tara:strand:- start:426 stop:593 length:168 start_codon:yes stop_codon:yes gene_type:complete
MKRLVERSQGSNPMEHSNKSVQMDKKDKDDLMKILEGMTPEEILEVKRLIDKIDS